MQALPLKTGVKEGQALTGSLEELIEAFKAFKVKFSDFHVFSGLVELKDV